MGVEVDCLINLIRLTVFANPTDEGVTIIVGIDPKSVGGDVGADGWGIPPAGKGLKHGKANQPSGSGPDSFGLPGSQVIRAFNFIFPTHSGFPPDGQAPCGTTHDRERVFSDRQFKTQ